MNYLVQWFGWNDRGEVVHGQAIKDDLKIARFLAVSKATSFNGVGTVVSLITQQILFRAVSRAEEDRAAVGG